MTEHQGGIVAWQVWGKVPEEAEFNMAVEPLALRSEVGGSYKSQAGAGCQ